MFDTSHVTNMSYIFNNISELTELNLSNWDFSSLTSAPNMYASSNISTINMTNAVFPINSSEFFSGLSTLSNIILDNCDTTQVTDMSKMFYACFGLNSLDLSSFDTNNVLNMNNMFSGAIKLQSITFGSKFVHKSDATTSSMFNGCPAPERPTGDTWSDVIFD